MSAPLAWTHPWIRSEQPRAGSTPSPKVGISNDVDECDAYAEERKDRVSVGEQRCSKLDTALRLSYRYTVGATALLKGSGLWLGVNGITNE